MMYLILTAMFATSSFAQSPLLTIDQHSGYTPPQYAMQAHCTLEPFIDTTTQVLSYHVYSHIFRDRTGTDGAWKIETNTDTLIVDKDLNQVQTWIKEAAVGPFKQGTTPCDIGTVKIMTETYPLFYSQDCGKKVENQHPSALKLIAWFRQACSLEGTRRP